MLGFWPGFSHFRNLEQITPNTRMVVRFPTAYHFSQASLEFTDKLLSSSDKIADRLNEVLRGEAISPAIGIWTRALPCCSALYRMRSGQNQTAGQTDRRTDGSQHRFVPPYVDPYDGRSY